VSFLADMAAALVAFNGGAYSNEWSACGSPGKEWPSQSV